MRIEILYADDAKPQFRFFRTRLLDVGSHPTAFYWVIVDSVDDPTKEFYLKQCGDYNPETQTGVFISGFNLRAQIVRYERGHTKSHHRHYVDAQDSAANKYGVFAERYVKGQSTNEDQFIASFQSGIIMRRTAILSATEIEPFEVNLDDTGRFLGNINFAPNYAQCPQ